MDEREVTERFLEFEEDLGLFEICSSSIRIWERLRFRVHRDLLQKNGIIGQAQSSPNEDFTGYLKGMFLWAKNGLWKNSLFADQHEFLFVGHPRRKLLEDGYWWDLYCDPVHRKTDLDYLHIESAFNLKHRKPARTERLRYTDFLRYSGTLQRKFGMVDVELDPGAQRELDEASKAIKRRFGSEVNLVDRAIDQLEQRASVKPLYKWFVSTVDPEVVVLVVSYDNETFIEVCKEAGIPVVELQHGTIHERHMGYAFSGDRTKETFPDYVFTFGEYWNEIVDFPIPEDRLVPVGYPYLEMEKENYENKRDGETVLFISQGAIGAQLSKFSVEFSRRYPDYDVVYKLHPGEYDGWRKDYPWLIQSTLQVVDTDSPPLYQLFAEASAQVGVSSTAIYEGLSFGLETYLLEISSSERLQSVLDRGDATTVTDIDHLAEQLGTSSNRPDFDRNPYFAENAVESIETKLEEIALRTQSG